MKHIPQNEIQTGRIYRLNSRNLLYGVAIMNGSKFIGIRRKWNRTYLEIENHWDTGAPWGTAKPVALMPEEPPTPEAGYNTMTPFTEAGEKLFIFLNGLEAKYRGADNT